MKRICIAACSIGLLVILSVAHNNAAQVSGKKGVKQRVAPKTSSQKISYGVGLNIGRSLKRDGLKVDPQWLAQGVADIFSGNTPLLSEEEFRQEFTMFQQAASAAKTKDGKAFLAANGKKEGVQTTQSGLQYKVLRAGTGKTPELTDRVTTHYHGTLINGTVFDSSVERQEPATFPVNGVIKGWTEALSMMKVGAKWRLFVPSELAYGARGSGSKIGPHSVLVFDVELLSIE